MAEAPPELGRSRITCREERTSGARGWSSHGRYGGPVGEPARRRAGWLDPNRGARPRCSLSLPAAPEPLSPAGGAGEEAPDEDEEEAEAEDPERPAGASGTRSGGGGGGGGGAGAGGGGGPGGALPRRAVTLRVLLKDAQLEPGAGVLSIYYLVSTPHPIPAGARRETEAQGSLAAGGAWERGGETEARTIQTQHEPRRSSFTKHPILQRRN